jgi:CDP-2,3-bis-(O-geranylgeranyl)-sn-glycerol synthase
VSDILQHIALAVWIFLPAGIANAAPVFANKIPVLNRWNTPLDFGMSWRGKRLLGANKRFRGLAFGVVVAATVSVLQYLPDIHYQASIQSVTSAAFSGALLGFGALMGDAIESFFKRQRGVKPGDSWFPFDQTDYIIGGLACWLWYVNISWQLVGYIFVVYFGLHLLTRYIGYKLGINDKAI